MKCSFSYFLLQEFHLTQTYHEGLLKLQNKEYEKARELLEAVVKDPLMSTDQVISCPYALWIQIDYRKAAELAFMILS